MSSPLPCPAPRRSSPTALETAVGSSRSRPSGRSTSWEPRWLEPATRQSGMTTSPNCMSSWLENKWEQKKDSNDWHYKFPLRPLVCGEKHLSPIRFPNCCQNRLLPKEATSHITALFHNKHVKHWSGCVPFWKVSHPVVTDGWLINRERLNMLFKRTNELVRVNADLYIHNLMYQYMWHWNVTPL